MRDKSKCDSNRQQKDDVVFFQEEDDMVKRCAFSGSN